MVPRSFLEQLDRLLRVRSEIVFERHAPVGDRILLPLRRTFREGELRFHDLLEDRVFGGLLLRDFVEDFELPLQHGVRRLVRLHAVLRLHLDVILRVAVDRLPGHVLRSRFHRVRDDRLHIRRQGIEFRLVERNFELLGVLMVALQHVDLGDVGKAKDAVRGRVVEFGRIEQATIHRRDDFAAGERVDRGAHAGEHVNGDADGAEFQALEVVDLGDRLLVPAERLRRHRPVRERDDVRADRGENFVEQLLATTVFVPGEQHVRVHRVGRAGAPERERGLFAVVIDEHAVAAVEHALRHRVEQLERGDDGAGGQHFDLQIAAGHIVDLFGEVDRVFVEDVLRRPGALPAHIDRAGRLHDVRRRDGGSRCDTKSSGLQKFAAACRGRARLILLHEFLPCDDHLGDGAVFCR